MQHGLFPLKRLHKAYRRTRLIEMKVSYQILLDDGHWDTEGLVLAFSGR